MKLENLITDRKGNLAMLRADEKITKAAELMKEFECGNVIVEDQGKPVGILTDRDIAIHCIAEGSDPSKTTVEKCMTKNPVSLQGNSSGSEALQQMKEKGISRVIVVDSSGQAQGVVTADHILKYLVSELDDLASLSKTMHKRERKAA